MTDRTFVKNHPVICYCIITFVISWGGFVLAAGPGGLSSPDWQASASFPLMVGAMLAGPTVAGLLMTGLTAGRAGFRELRSRLLKWRVGAQWYAVALLPAPILSLMALLALGLSCPLFIADSKVAVVIPGVAAGLTTIFEEVGWTGFAVPRLRLRRSILGTGLILGIVWGVWHLLQQVFISGSYAETIPLPLYLAVAILNTVAGLTAYRVLLVWLYDRTGSLLVTTLMHASLTACNIFLFRPEATGVSFMAFGLVFTALQWLLVALLAVIDRGRLRRQPA